MQHLVFLDNVSFLPFLLRKLLEAFGLTSSKLWYPHRPQLPEIAQGMHTYVKTNNSRTWSGAQQQPKKNIYKKLWNTDTRLSIAHLYVMDSFVSKALTTMSYDITDFTPDTRV